MNFLICYVVGFVISYGTLFAMTVYNQKRFTVRRSTETMHTILKVSFLWPLFWTAFLLTSLSACLEDCLQEVLSVGRIRAIRRREAQARMTETAEELGLPD